MVSSMMNSMNLKSVGCLASTSIRKHGIPMPMPASHVVRGAHRVQWAGQQHIRPVVHANVVIKSKEERKDDEIQEVLYSPEQLNEILDDLGRQIGAQYKDKDLLVLGVLKGGFMFTADLIRHINPVPRSLEVDFFKASSYGSGTSTSGHVKLDGGFDLNSVRNKHVLIAEDIIDSGLTMSSIVSLLRSAGAMSVRVAVLLDKRSRRLVTFDADYVGIVCPDQFVVGYGIDYDERFRWLPYVGVPKPEVIEAMKAAKVASGASMKKSDAASSAAQQHIASKNTQQTAPQQSTAAASTASPSTPIASGGHVTSSGHQGAAQAVMSHTSGLSLGNGNGKHSSNGNGVGLLSKPQRH